MEWLRSVDLAEYAPNLRGSGVHGGLIVSGSLGWPPCLGVNCPGLFHYCDKNADEKQHKGEGGYFSSITGFSPSLQGS